MATNRIYVFYVEVMKKYLGIAIAEDGQILKVSERPGTIHQCRFFMGVTSDRQHSVYRKHYQNGFEIIFVGEQENLPLNVVKAYHDHERTYFEDRHRTQIPGGEFV